MPSFVEFVRYRPGPGQPSHPIIIDVSRVWGMESYDLRGADPDSYTQLSIDREYVIVEGSMRRTKDTILGALTQPSE